MEKDLIVSVNGIVQQPGVDYTVDTNTDKLTWSCSFDGYVNINMYLKPDEGQSIWVRIHSATI